MHDDLFTPFQIMHPSLKSRIIGTNQPRACGKDRNPDLRSQPYHREKAKGGIAMTMFARALTVERRSKAVSDPLIAQDHDKDRMRATLHKLALDKAMTIAPYRIGEPLSPPNTYAAIHDRGADRHDYPTRFQPLCASSFPN